MKFDFSTFSVLMAGFAPLVALLLAFAHDRRQRKQTEKPPQTEKLLRPPGHSLAIRLEETFDAFIQDIFVACASTACAGIAAISFAQCLAAGSSVGWLALFGLLLGVAAFAGIWMALRAFHHLRQAQNIRLGLRGEQAVAEVLNEAAESGFRSFHDVPGGKNWNIDHVAVGTCGVFLVETKARRRRASRNGQASHEVIFDGNVLQFPTGKDDQPLEQAKRNAAWLSNYLTKKTGESVRVEPLVILPGWFVRTTARGNFPVKVMNANYLVRFLQGQTEMIQRSQVRRIIAALDEKCRDVEF